MRQEEEEEEKEGSCNSGHGLRRLRTPQHLRGRELSMAAIPDVMFACSVMPYNSAHHCVVEVENFLFVLGGEDQWNPNGGVHNGEYVPWLYCYDPVMDVWARKQDMNTKRAIHTLAVMNDRLYAIGGNHLKGFSHLDVMLVECYDPKGDQWNILQTPILEGRSGPGCAVLEDSIYLVGGYSWSMNSDSEKLTLHCRIVSSSVILTYSYFTCSASNTASEDYKSCSWLHQIKGKGHSDPAFSTLHVSFMTGLNASALSKEQATTGAENYLSVIDPVLDEQRYHVTCHILNENRAPNMIVQ
ncbi:hypothetical protein BTVI_145604 [Pitangus sulphuratus]|nr:hypothetical protein BTVI_145604 [Pitangus sulphuratus]